MFLIKTCRTSNINHVQKWSSGATCPRPAYYRCLAFSKSLGARSSRLMKTTLACRSQTDFTKTSNRTILTYKQRMAPSNPERNSSLSMSGSRPPDYQLPQAGPLSLLPRTWVPYAELMRLDKPAGTYYLFFPCLFSSLLAASYTQSPVYPLVTSTALFLGGALIMRGAGCTINDLWDRNLDPHVARTRLRPIARGAVTPFNALVFTGLQLLAGLGILLQFKTDCLFYAIPSLLLVGTYPLAKRVTHYPQFILGLTFSWGAILGFPAIGVDLSTDPAAQVAVAALYASCVSWTVLYDMIYAHMDIRDDAKVGIKSIALRHEKQTKAILAALVGAQASLLAVAGAAVGASPIYFLGSCGSALVTLSIMIWNVRLKEVGNCWWWFKNGAWFTGGGIASGLLAEYFFGFDHLKETAGLRACNETKSC